MTHENLKDRMAAAVALPRRARKFVQLDSAALTKAGASSVLALAAGALGGTVALAEAEPDAGEKTKTDEKTLGVVRVEGPLAQRAVEGLCAYVDGYDAVAARFELALEGSDGVLMVIDSPGGDVAGLEAGVERMIAARAAHPDKRVVAYVDEMAASAAYRIASGVADEIVVPASGLVGSIGCIGAVVDLREQARADGERWTVVRSPAGKDEAMPYAPVEGLAEERLTARVEAAAEAFIAAVSRSRGLTSRAVRAMDGALYTGADAVKAGLADRVGTITEAAELASRGGARPQKDTKMKGMLAAVVATLGLDAGTSEADAIEALGARLKGHDSKAASLEAQLAAYRDKAAEVETVRAELAALKAAQDAAALVALVDGAVAAKKITPARRDAFLTKAQAHGATWAQGVIDELPVLVGATPPPAPAATDAEAVELTAAERAMCARKGVDVASYVRTRNEINARTKRNSADLARGA